ncbi:MAG: ATP-binding cassette domain-containing protein [Pseudomonadota bacterium]
MTLADFPEPAAIAHTDLHRLDERLLNLLRYETDAPNVYGLLFFDAAGRVLAALPGHGAPGAPLWEEREFSLGALPRVEFQGAELIDPLLAWALERTRPGRLLKAVICDREMAAVMGLVHPSGGRDATPLPPHLRAKLGVGYMPEDRRLVPELTVQENILLPAWANDIPGAETRLAWIYALMPEVEGFSSRRALQLSGGQQKLAALARALMNGERLMLLDEPFEGIAPALAHRLGEVLHRLKAQGPAVLVSESDYRHCAGLVDKVFVIERGVVSERAEA